MGGPETYFPPVVTHNGRLMLVIGRWDEPVFVLEDPETDQRESCTVRSCEIPDPEEALVDLRSMLQHRNRRDRENACSS